MTIRRFTALPLLAASWMVLAHPRAAAAQPPPPVEDEVTQVLIPMELLANRPLVRAMVNGQGPVSLLVVPDARRTSIDPELGEALKIKKSGNAADTPVEIAFPKHTVKTTVAVEDISRYVAEFPAAVRPRGVLSLSAFGDQLVTLDYPRWKLVLETGALEEPNGKNVFPLTKGLQLRLPLVIADQSIECIVDPMFPSDLIVPATVVGNDASRIARDVGVMRTPMGLRRVREVKLAATATLGPYQLKTPIVLVTDFPDLARIGAGWLGRYEVTYDVAHERVRIDRASAVMSRQ